MSIWIIIAIVALLVFFMLWAISDIETSCTGNCDQGRNCNCLLGRKDDE
jgi:hypothetical protein